MFDDFVRLNDSHIVAVLDLLLDHHFWYTFACLLSIGLHFFALIEHLVLDGIHLRAQCYEFSHEQSIQFILEFPEHCFVGVVCAFWTDGV